LQLFYLLRERTGSRLTAFELMNRFGVDLQLKYGLLARDPTASPSPWYVLAEVNRMKGGVPGALQSAPRTRSLRARRRCGGGESEADRALMWAAREQMSEVQSKEGASIKHDVSVPIGAVPALIADGIAAVEKVIPGVRPCPSGTWATATSTST